MANANIKYLSARRYQVGWYDELPDPYEDSNYSAHSTNNKPGQNAYWNFLGIDGSKIYESWIKFSFTDEDMLNPQQVGSINFNLRFEFHKDRSSAKNDIPIRCYIFPTDLDKAYKIRTSSQMEKDKKYITYAETKVDFNSSYKLANFNLTIKNPTSNTYLAVLKIHPDYEVKGWCPVVWYGQGAVGGALNSTARAWKSNEILPSSYDITFEKSDGDSQVVKAEYNDSLKGSYITNIPTGSKDYYTFLGWSKTDNASTRDENLYKSTGVLGPFTSNTTLYPVFEKDINTYVFSTITETNCNIKDLSIKIITKDDKNNDVEQPITPSIDEENKCLIIAYETNKDLQIKIENLSSCLKPGHASLYEDGAKINIEDSEIKQQSPYNDTTVYIQQKNYTVKYYIDNNLVKIKENVKYNDDTSLSNFTPELKYIDKTSQSFAIGDEKTIEAEQSYNFNSHIWDPEDELEIDIKFLGGNLQFIVPETTTEESNYVFKSSPEIKVTTFGQQITIADDNTTATATEETFSPTDMDLTITIDNIWGSLVKGKKFIFKKNNDDDITNIIINYNAEDQTFLGTNDTLAGYGNWWTTHRRSPFAEFYLDFDNGARIYLEEGVTLYPVNKNKYLSYGNKYFNPVDQTWKTKLDIEGGE